MGCRMKIGFFKYFVTQNLTLKRMPLRRDQVVSSAIGSWSTLFGQVNLFMVYTFYLSSVTGSDKKKVFFSVKL